MRSHPAAPGLADGRRRGSIAAVKPTAQSGGKSAAAQPAAPAPVILSYKFPLAPRAHQHAALQRILDDQRRLYNRMLRRHNFSWMRVKMTEKWVKPTNPELYKDVKRIHNASTGYMSKAGTSKQLTDIRKRCPEYDDVPVSLSRGTLKNLDLAMKAFFSRVKKGGPPGYPKYKSKRDHRYSFDTVSLVEAKGWGVEGSLLRLEGVRGKMRIRMHRELPGKPTVLRITRQMNHATGKVKWWASFGVKVEGKPRPSGKPAIGMDAGVKALAACSDGKRYKGIQAGRDGLPELRRAQRTYQRRRKVAKQSGKWDSRGFARSKERVRRAHKRVANVRDNNGHHVANDIVGRASLVAVEKLNVKGMMAKGGAHKRGLNRAIADASMSALIGKLRYKAGVSGVEFVEVSASGTSQACSGCGAVVKKGLEVRVHNCPECGLKLDRDVNAARNILQRALQRKEGAAQ